ncbi:hypothetical protein ACIA8R_44005 [Nonomuraea sp. NPDC051191]|uniref:hypothetical protein n=1 Tax=Nonomuraea sp. NPDC051191 TaxID=3364372 RepID=UPI00379394CA
MSGIEIILGTLLGLIVNEACEISPWMARKLVRKAAYLRYPDTDQARVRAEELESLINERPGKLFKLATAIAFTASATIARLTYRAGVLWSVLREVVQRYILIMRARRRTYRRGRWEKTAVRTPIRVGEGKVEAAAEAAAWLQGEKRGLMTFQELAKATSPEMEEHVRNHACPQSPSAGGV